MAGQRVGRSRYLIALLALSACAQTSSSAPSTLGSLRPLQDTTASSTTLLSQQSGQELSGYAINVLDGHTFDLQPPRQGVTRLTLGLIEVPDIGTCEGTEARALFASLIAGKMVRIDTAGVLWQGDLDVGLAMIQYGYATPSADAPAYYIEDSKLATPFSCANTTTTTIPVIVVPLPTRAPKPKPTAPPTETVATDPVTEPTPTPAPTDSPTAPPVAQPPQPTQAPDTPAPVVTTADDGPVTPKTPRTPDTPATPAP